MQRQLLVNHLSQKRELFHDIMTQRSPKDTIQLIFYGSSTAQNVTRPFFKSCLHTGTSLKENHFHLQVLLIGGRIWVRNGSMWLFLHLGPIWNSSLQTTHMIHQSLWVLSNVCLAMPREGLVSLGLLLPLAITHFCFLQNSLQHSLNPDKIGEDIIFSVDYSKISHSLSLGIYIFLIYCFYLLSCWLNKAQNSEYGRSHFTGMYLCNTVVFGFLPGSLAM